ncbi:hypothetical protein GCM10022393_17780 [Aquimarina addita]|uniref:Lipoprotein n=1 Tax=Aquimarina addita TaxID=870485 RepID=A0ABP6UGX7_9FLAO
MKRKFVNIALVIAILVAASCKNQNNAENQDNIDNVEEVAENNEEPKEEEVTKVNTSTDTPKFSDPKVQEYVDSYEAYIAEYKKVVASKDMTAYATLGQKGQELSVKAQEISGNLSGDDIQKLSDYSTAKAAQLQELNEQLMQQ